MEAGAEHTRINTNLNVPPNTLGHVKSRGSAPWFHTTAIQTALQQHTLERPDSASTLSTFALAPYAHTIAIASSDKLRLGSLCTLSHMSTAHLFICCDVDSGWRWRSTCTSPEPSHAPLTCALLFYLHVIGRAVRPMSFDSSPGPYAFRVGQSHVLMGC